MEFPGGQEVMSCSRAVPQTSSLQEAQNSPSTMCGWNLFFWEELLGVCKGKNAWNLWSDSSGEPCPRTP